MPESSSSKRRQLGDVCSGSAVAEGAARAIPSPLTAIARDDLLSPSDPSGHYFHIEAGLGYHNADNPETGFCLTAWMHPEHAHYIVRATNVHAELLAALDNITECAAAGPDGCNMDLWIAQARAALAKARGETA